MRGLEGSGDLKEKTRRKNNEGKQGKQAGKQTKKMVEERGKEREKWEKITPGTREKEREGSVRKGNERQQTKMLCFTFR